MKNNQIKVFAKKVMLINLAILIISSIILLIFQKYSWLLGYLLGALTSYITFIMHANSVNKLGITTKNPTKSSIASALLRLSISAICLLIALFVSWIDLLATFIGMLVIKVVIIVTTFVSSLKENRKSKGGNVQEQ